MSEFLATFILNQWWSKAWLRTGTRFSSDDFWSHTMCFKYRSWHSHVCFCSRTSESRTVGVFKSRHTTVCLESSVLQYSYFTVAFHPRAVDHRRTHAIRAASNLCAGTYMACASPISLDRAPFDWFVCAWPLVGFPLFTCLFLLSLHSSIVVSEKLLSCARKSETTASTFHAPNQTACRSLSHFEESSTSVVPFQKTVSAAQGKLNWANNP